MFQSAERWRDSTFDPALPPSHQPQLTKFNAFSWIEIFCLGSPLKNKQPAALVALGTPSSQQHKTDAPITAHMTYFNLSHDAETISCVTQLGGGGS